MDHSFNPPPSQFNLIVIQKLIAIYKLWHEFLPNFPKDSKYTLGQKIDTCFLETVEYILKAGYAGGAEKQVFVRSAPAKLDLLKFFLQLAWEIQSLDNKKYIKISEKLNEVGKMLGGWIKSLN